MVFDKWKPGKKGKDNGVLVLLALKERRWSIVTGLGIEKILPNDLCQEIGNKYLVPYFKGGKYGEGLYEGISQIAKTILREQNMEIDVKARGHDRINIPAIIATKVPINRTFEDLTLGMNVDDFKIKMVSKSVTAKEEEKIGKETYWAYSKFYNMNISSNEPKMKEIDNVYEVIVSFFEGKLFFISIEYTGIGYYRFHPQWDDFIYNAKEKYGKGKEGVVDKKIVWNDGKTTLVINEEPLQQFNEMGNCYVVSYLDNDIYSKLEKEGKKLSPKF